MFKNAGNKVKSIATITFILIAIGCLGLCIMGFDAYRNGEIYIISAIALLVFGYVTCLASAAFGQLTEDISAIRRTLESKPTSISTVNHDTPNSTFSTKATAESSQVTSLNDTNKVLSAGVASEGQVIVDRTFAFIKCPYCGNTQSSKTSQCNTCKAKFISKT